MQPISAGVVSALVAFTSTFAVVLAGLSAVGGRSRAGGRRPHGRDRADGPGLDPAGRLVPAADHDRLVHARSRPAGLHGGRRGRMAGRCRSVPGGRPARGRHRPDPGARGSHRPHPAGGGPGHARRRAAPAVPGPHRGSGGPARRRPARDPRVARGPPSVPALGRALGLRRGRGRGGRARAAHRAEHRPGRVHAAPSPHGPSAQRACGARAGRPAVPGHDGLAERAGCRGHAGARVSHPVAGPRA